MKCLISSHGLWNILQLQRHRRLAISLLWSIIPTSKVLTVDLTLITFYEPFSEVVLLSYFNSCSLLSLLTLLLTEFFRHLWTIYIVMTCYLICSCHWYSFTAQFFNFLLIDVKILLHSKFWLSVILSPQWTVPPS